MNDVLNELCIYMLVISYYRVHQGTIIIDKIKVSVHKE